MRESWEVRADCQPQMWGDGLGVATLSSPQLPTPNSSEPGDS